MSNVAITTNDQAIYNPAEISHAEFLRAERVWECSINVTYLIDGAEVVVEWLSVNARDGEILDYYYPDGRRVDCEDDEIADRVELAIQGAETDENIDIDIYLDIRDGFEMNHCQYIDDETVRAKESDLWRLIDNDSPKIAEIAAIQLTEIKGSPMTLLTECKTENAKKAVIQLLSRNCQQIS